MVDSIRPDKSEKSTQSTSNPSGEEMSTQDGVEMSPEVREQLTHRLTNALPAIPDKLWLKLSKKIANDGQDGKYLLIESADLGGRYILDLKFLQALLQRRRNVVVANFAPYAAYTVQGME